MEKNNKRFTFSLPVEYVQGHLRSGHYYGSVEAESLEEAIELITKNYDCFDFEVDDYRIDDIGSPFFDDLEIEGTE